MVVLVLVGSLAVSFGTAHVQEAAGDVPMNRGDAGNTGVMPGPGPDPDGAIVERWRHEMEDIHSVSRFGISANAAVVDGIVYFGGPDGSIRAVEAESGE